MDLSNDQAIQFLDDMVDFHAKGVKWHLKRALVGVAVGAAGVGLNYVFDGPSAVSWIVGVPTGAYSLIQFMGVERQLKKKLHAELASDLKDPAGYVKSSYNPGIVQQYADAAFGEINSTPSQ